MKKKAAKKNIPFNQKGNYADLFKKVADNADQDFKTKLQHAQKMETIGRLTGGISHDFNNILGSIMLNAELAVEDVEENSETAYALNQILNASHRAKDLIEQILEFSRNDSSDRVPFNITVIVKETLKMLKAVFPATMHIKTDIPNDIGTILTNPVEIQQLIINLCTNAAHAMQKKGGTMMVRIAKSRLTKTTAKQPNLPPGQYLKLSIIDNGKGIPPDDLKHIYDPFFSTMETGKGTGMGLSVVRNIVQNHNGGMTVDSKPDKGTTINIFFPMMDSHTSRKKTIRAQSIKGKKSILFIDDEPALCDVGYRMLTKMGHAVITSRNSREALNIINKQPTEFDLVITDMTMPHMTGIELTKKLQEIRNDLPVILCTGYNETDTREKAVEAGIRKFLVKPYTKSDIAGAVRDIFNNK